MGAPCVLLLLVGLLCQGTDHAVQDALASLGFLLLVFWAAQATRRRCLVILYCMQTVAFSRGCLLLSFSCLPPPPLLLSLSHPQSSPTHVPCLRRPGASECGVHSGAVAAHRSPGGAPARAHRGAGAAGAQGGAGHLQCTTHAASYDVCLSCCML